MVDMFLSKILVSVAIAIVFTSANAQSISATDAKKHIGEEQRSAER